MSGTLYWITGLAGAGKTTIGKLLCNHIKKFKPNIFLLDGDIARWSLKELTAKAEYSKDSRRNLAHTYSRICKILTDQDIDVICCTVGMFDSVRDWNRENIKNYREIFIDVPIEILIQRDKKGLYSQVKEGKTQNVVGMDLKLEYPKTPDLKIINDGTFSPEHALNLIIEKFPELRR